MGDACTSPMIKGYLRLVRRTLRSLKHPNLVKLRWWRLAIRPLRQRELWIPRRDPVANGVTIGVFFSMLILMPFQMLAAALIAMRARANVPMAMAFCWISNPVSFAPLLWLQCVLGNWMRKDLGVPMPRFLVRDVLTVPEIGTVNSASFLLGMMSFAVIGALLAYPLVHLFALLMPQLLPVSRRRKRILAPPGTSPARHPEEPL